MAQAADATDKIRVRCDSCGAAFRVPASKAGKQGPCPKCGATVVVPQPVAEEPPAEGDIDWSALAGAEAKATPAQNDGGYDFVPSSAPAPAPVSAAGLSAAKQLASLTPQQRAALAKRAEDLARSGKRPQVEDGDDNLWGFPSFLMGLTLSVAGALLGAAIWFGLLAATGREMRLLAWGIGALAGGGMFAGYQKHDFGAGLLAAVFALGGIVLAKLMIVSFGQGYLADRATEQFVDSMSTYAEMSIAEEYENSAIEKVSHEDAYEGALEYRLRNFRREQGWDLALWWNMLDFKRAEYEEPFRKELATLDEEGIRDLYRREALLDPAIEKKLEVAREAYRVEQGLPADDQLEDPFELLDEDSTEAEWEAASKRSEELYVEHEELWKDFEPLAAAAEAEAFADVEALTPEEVVTRYDELRERRREETRQFITEMKSEAENWSADLTDQDRQEIAESYPIFRPRDILFYFLALATAFGIGTGMRGDD